MIEILMDFIVLTIILSTKLIKFEFRKLDDQIEKAQLTPLQVCCTFKNIVEQMMDIDRYKPALNIINSYIFTIYKYVFLTSDTKLVWQVTGIGDF